MTPGLLAFVASPAIRRNPHRLYQLLQRLDPVHESPFGLWVLSRHADVQAFLRNPALGSDEDKADDDAFKLDRWARLFVRQGAQSEGAFREVFTQVMLFRDPPDHTRLRSLVAKAFTPKRVEALGPRIAELVAELLEAPAERGELELMSELAYPLPARVICELLGVPRADVDLFVSRAPALGVGLDPAPMRTPDVVRAADVATRELLVYLDGLIADRQAHPGDDLLSALIHAEEAGDRLSHRELMATVLLLLIAGHETTANLIGNGILALLRHPAELQRLREDEALDRSAVDELLRYDGPIQMTQRISLEPVPIGNDQIPSGRYVILCVAAANRDPAVFADPNRLDLARDPNPHVAFGGGAHFCIGAALARLEGRMAIGALVRRFPRLRLRTERPQWRPSFTVRGLTKLHLSL
ncbi:MAG: cytochrome [Acidimicrobiales bacterium]|nr:cytochrome [Acidimicrobiales bacterium]